MAMVFCTQCGHQNPADSRFCSNCGSALARPAEATSTISLVGIEDAGESEEGLVGGDVALDMPTGAALLVVKRGPNAGSRFLLDSDVTTVGRHPESDIFLDDVTVSRRHAEFFRRPGGFGVRDVGSLNGTYLNRERIEEAEVGSGDEVQIGKFRLVFLTRAAGEGR